MKKIALDKIAFVVAAVALGSAAVSKTLCDARF